MRSPACSYCRYLQHDGFNVVILAGSWRRFLEMFTETLKIMNAQPLLVRRVGNTVLERGGNLCWAEFGETDKKKVKHTILYFHGAPACRYEPVMHSCSSYDKRSFNTTTMRTLEYNDSHSLGNVDVQKSVEVTEELDVYTQRGIRLICIERPGFGDSSFVEDRTVADYVDDVVEVTQSNEFGLTENFTGSEKAEPSTVSKKRTSIYVVGYSAGGPYALAMRSLFRKKQIEFIKKQRLALKSNLDCYKSVGRNSVVRNDDVVVGDVKDNFQMVRIMEEEAEVDDDNIIDIAGVCVVASSVSAAEDIQYSKSLEGITLNIFFSLPLSVQANFYSMSIGAFLYGIRGFVYSLLWVYDIKTKNFIDDGSEEMKYNEDNSVINSSSNRKNENENENERSTLSKVLSKLSAIDQIITRSLLKHDGRAMATDTLAAQWGGRPWGFKLTPTPNQQGEKPLPPILLFYSKSDFTVPAHTGITLHNKLLGDGEPIWLSGGHSCFVLHLNTILDKLLNCSSSDSNNI